MPLTDKQAAFVAEYLTDMNGAGAYRRAGYTAASDQVAASCAHKLLRNAEIADAIDRAQCARMADLALDADWVVERFRLVYLRAAQDRDHGAALKALENIGRYLGLYERHPRQRYLTPEDADRLRAELEARGFCFERANAPALLSNDPAVVRSVRPVVATDHPAGA